jgi:hypothetical protein
MLAKFLLLPPDFFISGRENERLLLKPLERVTILPNDEALLWAAPNPWSMAHNPSIPSISVD